MSSSTSGGSPFFGGLYSGNNRRPSMFTAKYRLREERKKVIKMSLAKIKRIEDPESFLRRSVLINNTMKQLQNDVREEKMMRHGVGYSQRFSPCLPYRKSFVYSRLNQMHLSLADDLDTGNMDTSPSSPSPTSKNSAFKSVMLGTGNHECKDGCDLQAIFSKTYAPPTPLLMPTTTPHSIDNNNTSGEGAAFSPLPLSSSDMSCDNNSSPATKKARTFIFDDSDGSALDVAVDAEVVVGDKESIDWPTSPTAPLFTQCSFSTTAPSSASSSTITTTCVLPSVSDSPSLVSPNANCLMSQTRLPSSDDNAIGAMDEDTNNVICGSGMIVDSHDELGSSSASEDFSLIDLSTPSSTLTTSTSTTTDVATVLSSSLTNGFNYSPPPACVAMPMSSSSTEAAHDLDEDDINFSSDTKENKCTFPVSSSDSSPESSCGNSFTSPITTISSLDRTHKCSNRDSHNCSQAANPANPSTTSETSDSKQKFSCGHSSVFGELQSVVFHSLIASLES